VLERVRALRVGLFRGRAAGTRHSDLEAARLEPVDQQLTHAEAAEILGVTESTVSWRMHEVRRMFAGGGSAEGFKVGPVVGDYVAKRGMGIEGDPVIAKGFRIPKEEFEEPPRTAADSARVKARADSVAKVKADSIKADSVKAASSSSARKTP
jgi:hypothetical protein